MADIGYIALLLALVASLYSATAFVFGKRRNIPALVDSARNGVVAVCGLVSIAVLALLYAILTHDFQIEYVASYTARDMSLTYLLSAIWAGNDGSLLFWAWLLALFGMIVVLQRRDVGRELVPYASTIVMVTEVFFLFLLLSVANPFHKLSFLPADGRGLNPLLENPGMLFHPPNLLGGYVGFTIPFAFAMSALLTRRLGDEWIVSIRRWTLVSWLLLSIGNIIGAWWAYVELGWGGYWAWDPVENASLLPWLTGTAFLHSIMMQRRRGILKKWNMVLVIITFSLSIFGTFLTRSGILSSVHTFADTTLGPFFLVFIGVTLFSSLGLLYYRSELLNSEAEMESLVSRESTFLMNNLFLVGAAFAVFLGEIFPLISEAVRGVKITVGAPFYNQVNGPIFLAIIFLAGVCALIGWRRSSVSNLMRNFLWPLAIALVIGSALIILGVRQPYAVFAFTVCAFVLTTILYEWFRGTRARRRMRGDNYLKAFFGLLGANRPRYGGYTVHIGLVLIAIGVIGSSFYNVEKEATLLPGESMSIKNYTLTYENKDTFQTETRQVDSATLSVFNGGKLLGKIVPSKYYSVSYEQSVTEVAIRSTPAEDLYAILIGWDDAGATSFKILVNPLVSWIWIGGIVLVLGGLIAFWPERRKLPVEIRVEARETVGSVSNKKSGNGINKVRSSSEARRG
ncbi:MAG: heme lyase CcmF/NrfE family subunit [Chloroflexi bacterium]|nr:heme lyase CcmF/NrfE family subunit [Chloroflexota bacterium]